MNLGPIKDRTKKQKTVKLTKQSGYAVAFAALALVGVIAAVSLGGNGNQEQQIADQPTTPTVQATVKPTATQNNKQVSGNVTVEDPTDVQMYNPVSEKQIIKDYAMDTLVYSSTLKHWCTHAGIDLACQEGASVFAALDGVVVSAQEDKMTGNTVIISHDGGLETRYMGLNTMSELKQGDKVKRGQVVGTAGNTALNETEEGCHLHFEVLLDGENVDPSEYLANLIK